jgi:uncharacterized RmlC-like cupin family protein
MYQLLTYFQSVIYVLKGKARMRWGEKLEYTAEAGPGDFIYVPPYVPVRLTSFSIEWPRCLHTAASRDQRFDG